MIRCRRPLARLLPCYLPVKSLAQEHLIYFDFSELTYYPICGLAVSVRIHEIRKACLELRRKSLLDAVRNLSLGVAYVYYVLASQSTALPISDVHNRQLKRGCFNNS